MRGAAFFGAAFLAAGFLAAADFLVALLVDFLAVFFLAAVVFLAVDFFVLDFFLLSFLGGILVHLPLLGFQFYGSPIKKPIFSDDYPALLLGSLFLFAGSHFGRPENASVSAKILKGAPVVERITNQLMHQVEEQKSRGLKPTVAIVEAASKQDSVAQNITMAFSKLGVEARHYRIAPRGGERDFLETLDFLGASTRFSAVLIERPLPLSYQALIAKSNLTPAKDVDGFHLVTQGKMLAGNPGCLPAAAACLELLDHYEIPVANRRAVVVGRSSHLGRPLALALLERDATVTVCHRQTRDLGNLTRQAEILVMAAGHPHLLKASMVSPGAVVLDLGATVKGKEEVLGDVDFAAVRMVCQALTPCPGGLGSLVTAMRLAGGVNACETGF